MNEYGSERMEKPVNERNEKLKNLSWEVVNKLKERNLYISTMESCTGGGVANALTNISGASEVMKEAFVTYSNEAKIKNGVSADTIEQYTVYSKEVAIEMAKAARMGAVRADIGVGITGSITRSDPNNPNSIPGEVFVAVNSKDETMFKKIILGNDDLSREEVKTEICIAAEEMVLEII